MLDIYEMTKKEEEHLRQLKNQKRLTDASNKQKARNTDSRRKFIVGAMLLDMFPEYKQLQPQKSKKEDAIEFEPLIKFFSTVANNKELIKTLELESAHNQIFDN